jgi:signal transduction histidine kinase
MSARTFTDLAFTTSTFLTVALPAGLLAVVADPARSPGLSFTWLGVVTVATGAAGLFFALFGTLVFRYTTGWWRLVAGLVGFAATGSIRGGLLGVLGLQAGAIEGLNWQYRLVGGALGATVLFPLAATLGNDLKAHRTRLSALTVNHVRLAELTVNAEAELASQRSILLRSVNDRLTGTISAISDEMTQDRSVAEHDRLAGLLLDAVEAVVRPLSREVLTGSLEQGQTVARSAPVGVDLKSWLIAASLAQPFRPWPVTLIWAVIGASTISSLNPGFPGVLAYPLFVGSTWALLSVAHRHLTPRLAAHEFPARAGIILTGYSVAAVIPAFLSWFPLAAIERPGFEALAITLLVLDPLATMLLCITLAMLAGLRAERERLLDEAETVSARLRWELAALKSQLRADRESISRSIHSDVQAVFVACAIELQTALRSGNVTRELLDQVMVRLTAMSEIAPDSRPAPPLGKALEELRSLWGEGVRITCDFESETEQALKDDDLLRATVIEVCSEAVVNAVKHAAATSIGISITLGQSLLHLGVRNNGRPVPTQRATGAGSRMFDEVAVEWGLRNTPDGTEFTAVLPVARARAEA